MNLSPDQLKVALKAFFDALPSGTMVKAITVSPRIGAIDTAAGVVSALVIADCEEDFMRFEQLIAAGESACRDKLGLSDRVMRQMDMANPTGNRKTPEVSLALRLEH